MAISKWKSLKRKTAYNSKFVKVYEEKVQLPNGSIIENYTLIEKPSVVMIVATDEKNNLITLKEYKHGAGEVLLTLPAGHLKKDEKPVDAARRELLEETGSESGEIYELGILYDYPSKDLHKVHVVRVKNLRLTQNQNLDKTEEINFELTPIWEIKEQIAQNKWQTSSALAAIALSGILS